MPNVVLIGPTQFNYIFQPLLYQGVATGPLLRHSEIAAPVPGGSFRCKQGKERKKKMFSFCVMGSGREVTRPWT